MALGKGTKLGIGGATLVVVAAVGIGLAQPAELPTVTVYKSPT